MKDILDIEKNMNLGDMALSDSQSLYYTPTETPMRDLSLSPLKDGGEIEVARSPEKSKKGHKRMVSNISNLLPFWWGNQQGIGVLSVNYILVYSFNNTLSGLFSLLYKTTTTKLLFLGHHI